RACPVAEDQLRLGVEEAAPQVLGILLGRGRAGDRRRPRDQREAGEDDERREPPREDARPRHYDSASGMFSLPAAWETCPAIASAWSCAWVPSVSASSASNLRPSASSSRSFSAKSVSAARSRPVCLAWAS